MKVAFAARTGACVDDHVVVGPTSIQIVDAAGSGFEGATPAVSAPVAAAIRAAGDRDVDVVAAVLDTLADIDEDAIAWMVRIRLDEASAEIAWLGGLEVHLVRRGRPLASTRGHRLDEPGAPRVVTRGLGAAYRDVQLDRPARWPITPGDQLVVTSTGISTSLDPAAVASAAAQEDPAAAVLAASRGPGFVVVIEVPARHG